MGPPCAQSPVPVCDLEHAGAHLPSQKRSPVTRLLLLLLVAHPALARLRSYRPVDYRSRTYWVESSLARCQPALARLDQNLRQSLALFPSHSRGSLGRLKFYVLERGKDNGLEYFQANAPAFHPELDPQWSNCVVVYCAQNYLDLSPLWALKSVQHELAHAYHLQHYPEDQPDILAAWRHALHNGLYPRAYARSNQLEYFAELSVMYFGRCDYPPVDRSALRAYDPQGYAMIERLWSRTP